MGLRQNPWATVTSVGSRPDLGIAVDITPAQDYPCDLEGSNTLGNGVGIKVSDPSVVCDEYLVEEMVKCCQEHDIKFQYDVIDRGGTEASSVKQSNFGVRVTAITIVSRYPHGPNSMVSMADVEAAIELLSNYLNRSFSL